MSIAGLDEQMRVIPENRIVNQPKLPPLTPGSERPLELVNEAALPQPGNVRSHPKRYVAGMSTPERLPSPVPNAGVSPTTGLRC